MANFIYMYDDRYYQDQSKGYCCSSAAPILRSAHIDDDRISTIGEIFTTTQGCVYNH